MGVVTGQRLSLCVLKSRLCHTNLYLETNLTSTQCFTVIEHNTEHRRLCQESLFLLQRLSLYLQRPPCGASRG